MNILEEKGTKERDNVETGNEKGRITVGYRHRVNRRVVRET